ncbi:MAG TPA: PKD domain-containing protein, partial [Aggregatilineales bacterium]|nr:PKD domain-containing protein [Aggregatilineales bacterium]
MKISRSSKIRFLGFSLILVVALGIVVNIATANTPQTGREEISVSVEQPNLAQEVTPEVPDVPQFTQTSCAMALDDLGDANPLTYQFSAVNTNNIASYAWDFDTANPGTLTGAGASVNFSYPGAGSYNIQLTCTPNAGFGAPIVLTGSVFVSQPPSPGFTLSPGTVVNSGVPVMFSTTNTTTPLSSTYEWCVTPAPIPPTTFDGANCPVFFDTTTNISFMFGTFATTHYVYLRATNAGDSAIAALSFVLNATAPSANFSVTPATGPAPLNISIDGTDFATGPLFPGAAGWQYTITYPDTSTTTQTAQDFSLSNLPVGLYTIRLDYAGPGGSGFVQRSVLVYTSAEQVEARFIVVMGDNVGADRRVCFINTSGGPVVNSYWDFDGDGNPDILDIPAITSDMPEGGDPNANTVCYIYPAASFNTNINVKLIVVGSDPVAVNSEAIQTINIIAKPEADFTWNPVNPVWGQFVDFTDASTGVIDEYFWEFDHGNNGSIDGTSTTQNPQNRQLPVGV